MAIDFPRSTYTAAEGVSAESWPASPSNGDTETNGAGDNFTFNGTSSLWVLDTGRTLTLSGGATYSWDGEKWIAQSHIPFRYFGPQSTDPTGLTADNEGDLYFNTVENEMRVYNGSSWDTITSVGNFNILTLSQSSGSGGGSATFNGTATRFQLSETPNVAQQLLISINGVVQEPQAGTSPTEGFAVDGNDIIFASAPATGSTFFGVQMGAAVNIGTPTDGSVTNVHVNASAAIAGSKISPDFGSQDIVTTGDVGIGTTSPGASLDIDNSADSSGTKSLDVKVVDNTAEVVHIAQGSNEYLSIDTTNSSELITIGNNTTNPNVVVPGGDVGIGTTAPQSIFHIQGPTGAADQARLTISERRNTGTTNWGIDFLRTYDSGGDNQAAGFVRCIRDGGASNAGMVFGIGDQTDSSREKMRIDSSGRLLVGTTTGVASGSPSSSVHLVDGGGGKIYMMRDDAGSTVAGNDLGMIRFYSNDGGAQESARIEAEADLDHGADDKPGRLVFSTTADGASSPTERLRIDSSGRFRIRPFNLSFPSAGEYETPVFVCLEGTTDPASNAGAATGALVRIMDCGSSANASTGYEIRNRVSGDLRFLNKDSNISNRSNFLIYQDTDTNNLENTFSFSYLAAVYAVGVYDHTTSSGANVNVAAGGQLRRSTSSIRFKTDVETLEDSYADALLNCRPVWYRSTAPADNPAHSHWGFIAEEIAEIDPRLVQWSTETTAFVDAVDDDGEPLFEQDGITRQKMRVKTTHEDPQPESVVYERFVPHLVNLIKRQKAQIEAMEARLTALEGGE